MPSGILSFQELQGEVSASDFASTQVHPVVRRGGLTKQKAARDRMPKCGKNEINVYVPGILESLIKQSSDFECIFNSSGAWSYMIFSLWNIGIFWLLLTLGSGTFRSTISPSW